MLHAVINGKGRRLPSTISAGDSLRKVFVKSEDILTATVFGRLAYLRGSLLWQIIDSTFRPKFLPSRKIVTLDGIEFWPRWDQAYERLKQSVEPDVVLRLSVGDPPQKVVLIIECKLDGFQCADQWAREWIAHEAECAGSEPPAEIRILALGGLPAKSEETVEQFVDQIHRGRGIEVKASAADWQDLRRSLDALELSEMAERYIVFDIKQALELHGYHTLRPMSELIGIARRYNISTRSMDTLRWDEQPPMARLKERASAAWDKLGARFRPIGEHPRLRWGEDIDG